LAGIARGQFPRIARAAQELEVMAQEKTGAISPALALQQVLCGYWLSQAVYVAAKL
jgi:hypothetical protein